MAEVLKAALKQPVYGPPETNRPKPSDPRVAALQGRWAELAGLGLAAKSRPVKILGAKLIVEVPASVWANELEFAKRSILEKIGISGIPEIPNIKDIRISLRD